MILKAVERSLKGCAYASEQMSAIGKQIIGAEWRLMGHASKDSGVAAYLEDFIAAAAGFRSIVLIIFVSTLKVLVLWSV